MKEEKVPRRLKRFYRENKEAPREMVNEMDTDYDGGIPSMEYEDLSQKVGKENYKEMQKIEQMDLEEKLALVEIEKFKKKNKRMPTKKESDQIADNIYTQFKEEGELSEPETGRGRRSRRERSEEKMPPSKRRRREREKEMESEREADEKIIPKGNIKDLFASSAGPTEKSLEDEFKIDGGEIGESEEIGEGEEIGEDDFNLKELDEEEVCPNCNEPGKIIYCSKCGAAFCEKCSKKEDTSFICPKCGEKNKL